MKKVQIFFLCILMLGLMKSNAQTMITKPGAFKALSDIGSPSIPDTASYSEPSQTYSISVSGSNIWFREDSFSMLWKK